MLLAGARPAQRRWHPATGGSSGLGVEDSLPGGGVGHATGYHGGPSSTQW